MISLDGQSGFSRLQVVRVGHYLQFGQGGCFGNGAFFLLYVSHQWPQLRQIQLFVMVFLLKMGFEYAEVCLATETGLDACSGFFDPGPVLAAYLAKIAILGYCGLHHGTISCRLGG